MIHSSMLGSQSNPTLLPSNNQMVKSKVNLMQSSASTSNMRINFETIGTKINMKQIMWSRSDRRI